ncbi:MAG: alternative ribosome rescue aminoacyl-tRNA hydrolase ArfB [Nostocoides sp.]
MDLVISPGPGVKHGLTITNAELAERFSKSPGPGGQSVNTTDSRVEVALDVVNSVAFSDTQRLRIVAVLGERLVDGRLVVTAYEHRSQHRNRAAARERMAALLRDAMAPPPPPRRATKPTRGSQERRLSTKKQRGQTKATRSRPTAAD